MNRPYRSSFFSSALRVKLLVCLVAAFLLCGVSTPLRFEQIASGSDIEELLPLDHKDYDQWKTISSTLISDAGSWIAFTIKPGKGDAVLHLRHTRSPKEYTIARGRSIRISPDEQWAFFVVDPDPEAVKQAKQDKRPSSAMPKASLTILNLDTGHKKTFPAVTSYDVPEKSTGWIAFQFDRQESTETAKPSSVNETYRVEKTGGLKRLTGNSAPKPSGRRGEGNVKKTPQKVERKAQANRKRKPREKSKRKKSASKQSAKRKSAAGNAPQEKNRDETKDKAGGKVKKPGKLLVLMELKTGREFRFPDSVSFQFDEQGTALAFVTSSREPDGDGMQLFDLRKEQLKNVLAGRGNYSRPVFDKSGTQLVFLTDRDDYDHPQPAWNAYHWKTGMKSATRIVDQTTNGMPQDWWLSRNMTPRFNESGTRIILASAPIPDDREKSGKKSEQQEEKKAKLDLWHWKDPFLQPQQLLRAEQERRRSYTAIHDLRTGKFIQLADKTVPNVSVDSRSPGRYVIGIAPDQYNRMRSWDYPGYNDIYLIDLMTGQKRKVIEKTRGIPRMSPAGKYLTWWDGDRRKWFCLAVEGLIGNRAAKKIPPPVDLGTGIAFPLFNELHDSPSVPPAYGSAGWLADDQGFLIYDRWDIWLVDPTGKKQPVNLTNGYGRKNLVRLRRIKLDPEERAISLQKPSVLSGLDHRTKASGYFRMQPVPPTNSKTVKPVEKKRLAKTGPQQNRFQVPGLRLERLIWLQENVSGLRKARKSNDCFLTRSTFRKFPDLWATDLEFQTIRRISHANPQQRDYRWGAAELVHWKSRTGQPLDGILYKPDGFDARKKYPMIVYFYERYSDRLHTHYPPAAGRSIINFSFYVSRGYLIFIPDIPYRVGEPGPSAADSILPGVQSLIDQGFVDSRRIGMQGHSWGGYQVAYLVTQTNMFACAESGAPVSNMTSAYGGIRWGSGMSRMFQYEKTQSRIGDTLWNAREKYIANSPLFQADRIRTPLLILHNDKDTAVPWYQGIELFVALRRLQRPAWMLNYNDEPHWVMKDENRLDFARRMQQFFDHYLKGDPMPEWMAHGIPAVDKGKKFGFEPAKSD